MRALLCCLRSLTRVPAVPSAVEVRMKVRVSGAYRWFRSLPALRR